MSDTFNHEADAWDSLLFTDQCNEPSNYGMHEKTCRHCQTSGLMWGIHHGRWRLFDPNYGLHICFPNFRVRVKNAAQ